MANNLFRLFLLYLVASFVSESYAKDRIEGVQYSDQGEKRVFEIKFSDIKTAKSNLEFKKNIVQITLHDSIVWPKIEKLVRVNGVSQPLKVMAYQYTKDSVRFRTVFPDNVKVSPEDFKVVPGNNTLKLVWKKPSTGAIGKNNYDDSYLEKLLAEKISEDTTNTPVKDFISTKQAAIQKEMKSTVAKTKESEGKSFNEYLVKYFTILVFVFGGFGGLLLLIRKGVIKKGKLNFLSNTGQIEQVSSTFLGPKKSLHIVKVGGQVFFLGATDNSINLLSELSAPSAVLKEAEKIISGDNFDESLDKQEETSKEFKIKEDITKPAAKESGAEFLDQIKEKVKNLKSLQ
ncbi:MAG: FliO/MopB family protein [Bacteriovoracaceae bacterium]